MIKKHIKSIVGFILIGVMMATACRMRRHNF